MLMVMMMVFMPNSLKFQIEACFIQALAANDPGMD